MTPGTIAKMENVAKFYGHKLVFKKISLAIEEGEACLLTGDNGAGKTTLLRLLAGLALPDAGTIELGQNCSVAFLGHETCMYPGMTGLENLEFWAAMAGCPQKKEALTRMLEEMNLGAYAGLQGRHFSRGMAQRLNIARVLLIKPSLLLLDEPFTGLDSKSLDLVGKKLKSFLANGSAMIMTSHDPEKDAFFTSKRLHIHNHGATTQPQDNRK